MMGNTAPLSVFLVLLGCLHSLGNSAGSNITNEEPVQVVIRLLSNVVDELANYKKDTSPQVRMMYDTLGDLIVHRSGPEGPPQKSSVFDAELPSAKAETASRTSNLPLELLKARLGIDNNDTLGNEHIVEQITDLVTVMSKFKDNTKKLGDLTELIEKVQKGHIRISEEIKKLVHDIFGLDLKDLSEDDARYIMRLVLDIVDFLLGKPLKKHASIEPQFRQFPQMMQQLQMPPLDIVRRAFEIAKQSLQLPTGL
ncbi:uncharacterized protein [Periplaneta americana]|uniref:uncharacterized protein n=1 Tax=Periplaneta americana TaxID=6978 RepID=UPI0037E8F2D8